MRGHWKQGRSVDAVLIQAFGFVGDDGAAPIQFRDRAPGFAMADALLLLRGGVDARLQSLCASAHPASIKSIACRATRGRLVPQATMAFNFFEPITAPKPCAAVWL